MSAEMEATICEIRRHHPGWGPRRIEHQLARAASSPAGPLEHLPCIKRHGLVELRQRQKRRDEFHRWERDRPMQLWQMDVMGGVRWTTAPSSRWSPGSMTTAASAWPPAW